MIERPLHHAYIATGQPQKCVSDIVHILEDIFADADTDLLINSAVTETLKIDSARDLVRQSQLRSGGESRCFVYGFETITIEAQNALLKALEEPAAGVHFFLITPNTGQLLETVRSRGLQIDICSQSSTGDLASLASKFLAADTVAARLNVVDNISNRQKFRQFLQVLEDQTQEEQTGVRSAVGFVSQWINDTGSSVSQLAEYLAISVSRDGE